MRPAKAGRYFFPEAGLRRLMACTGARVATGERGLALNQAGAGSWLAPARCYAILRAWAMIRKSTLQYGQQRAGASASPAARGRRRAPGSLSGKR